MANKERTILIVDDSEIDRQILRNILEENFEVIEAENGFSAIEMVTAEQSRLDAIMLDISMPHISGFDVLRLLEANGFSHIPVFLITAEATAENVTRAAQFHISEFISKPFNRDDILQRTRSLFGITTQYWLTMEDIVEMRQYIDKLEAFYNLYLVNFEKDKDQAHYRRMSDLMQILLTRYAAKHKDAMLDKEKIEIISKAAYFCDIGMLLVPDKMVAFSKDPESYSRLVKSHTLFGNSIVKLGESKRCEFFVSVCSEMCLNHHERYDGYGYPRGLGGKNLPIYGQMCRLVDEFDTILSRLYGANEMQVNLAMRQILKDKGMVSEDLMSLFEDSKLNFMGYYVKQNSR